jgi:hypothetical protein
MKKNTKIILSVLGVGVVITAIVLIVKKKKDEDLKKKILGAGNTEEDILNKDLESYDKYFSTSFNPTELAKTDAAFKTKVETLQTKLNEYIKAKKIDLPELKVDGLLGRRTMRAIVFVFGDRLLPLKYESQIDYYITQLK